MVAWLLDQAVYDIRAEGKAKINGYYISQSTETIRRLDAILLIVLNEREG